MAITRISPEEYFKQRMERKRLFEPATTLITAPAETEYQRPNLIQRPVLNSDLAVIGLALVCIVAIVAIVTARRF